MIDKKDIITGRSAGVVDMVTPEEIPGIRDVIIVGEVVGISDMIETLNESFNVTNVSDFHYSGEEESGYELQLRPFLDCDEVLYKKPHDWYQMFNTRSKKDGRGW